jgi:rfaE bifunctional protein nucleotidyltransferase chain/domain
VIARGPVVVIGDALLDRDVDGSVERLAPDAPVPVVDECAVRSRPGGAGLAALLAAGGDREVTLVTALGNDAAGSELRRGLSAAGIDVVDLGLRGTTPEKVRVRASGRPLLRLDRGGTGAPVGGMTAAARAAIGSASGVLVSDYGRGTVDAPGVRDAIAAVAGDVPVVWDPHPRGGEPVDGVALVTPNAEEAGRFSFRGAHAVCVTHGSRGAVLSRGPSGELVVPAPRVDGGDPCGAGDRFASRAAELLADGATVEEAVEGAVAASSAFVAAGGAGSVHVPAGTPTVVATGGCFDLLHVGHVRTLEAARAFGDRLVVLLNSDASVRRLKGPGRPVVRQDDRAAMLRALRCVDAVIVFEEDTPTAALERLRPEVWAKGGDYAGEDLPEAGALASWGATIVLLPYLDGWSTTKLIEEAGVRAV